MTLNLTILGIMTLNIIALCIKTNKI
jgi:hypothetical protein